MLSRRREDSSFFDRFREFLLECVPAYRGARGQVAATQSNIGAMDFNSRGMRDSNRQQQKKYQELR